MKQLKELHLGNNQLTLLPERIGGLVQLNFLNLRNNQLTLLPVRIGDLKQLEDLILTPTD